MLYTELCTSLFSQTILFAIKLRWMIVMKLKVGA